MQVDPWTLAALVTLAAVAGVFAGAGAVVSVGMGIIRYQARQEGTAVEQTAAATKGAKPS
jgi:hypothetical protein